VASQIQTFYGEDLPKFGEKTMHIQLALRCESCCNHRGCGRAFNTDSIWDFVARLGSRRFYDVAQNDGFGDFLHRFAALLALTLKNQIGILFADL
jgi:hypothetical protein